MESPETTTNTPDERIDACLPDQRRPRLKLTAATRNSIAYTVLFIVLAAAQTGFVRSGAANGTDQARAVFVCAVFYWFALLNFLTLLARLINAPVSRMFLKALDMIGGHWTGRLLNVALYVSLAVAQTKLILNGAVFRWGGYAWSSTSAILCLFFYMLAIAAIVVAIFAPLERRFDAEGIHEEYRFT